MPTSSVTLGRGPSAQGQSQGVTKLWRARQCAQPQRRGARWEQAERGRAGCVVFCGVHRADCGSIVRPRRRLCRVLLCVGSSYRLTYAACSLFVLSLICLQEHCRVRWGSRVLVSYMRVKGERVRDWLGQNIHAPEGKARCYHSHEPRTPPEI